jgi:glycosyltransferase involved in cell wall biosynthesis
LKILIDGRPIREPISGSAVFILQLIEGLKEHSVHPAIFLQSDRGRNRKAAEISNEFSLVSNGHKTMENVLYEVGFNHGSSSARDHTINHETYFGRLPFKSDQMIATIHDVIPLDFPHWFTWKNSISAKRNFNRQIRTADHCVFSSKFTESRAHELGEIRGNSNVIPLAVSRDIHANCGGYVNYGSELKISNSIAAHSYILAIGNVEPRKNLPLIAEAIAKLNKSLTLDLDLVIAGHANFEAHVILEDVGKRLGKKPIVLGFVSNEEKMQLYKYCACHVYASKYEGFGIPPVESLVIGAPTVIADNSSLSELIPSPELAFQSDSVEDLSQTIESNLYKNSHEVVGKGIENYIEFYKWGRVALDYLSVYRDLL